MSITLTETSSGIRTPDIDFDQLKIKHSSGVWDSCLDSAQEVDELSPSDVDIKQSWKGLSSISAKRCAAMIESPILDLDVQTVLKRQSGRVSLYNSPLQDDGENFRRSGRFSAAIQELQELTLESPLHRTRSLINNMVTNRISIDSAWYVHGQQTDLSASDEFRALSNNIKLSTFDARARADSTS